MWKLSNDGFVMQYMVTKPVVKDYVSGLKAKNQLELEGMLRAEIAEEKKKYLKDMSDRYSKTYENNIWQVYAPFGESMIDLSDFYSTLKRIEINAETVIVSPEDISVRARVWSYMAVGVYLEGELAGEIAVPRYKPISCTDITLKLKKGENHLFFICENLGVRDSRNILGMQFLDKNAVLSLEVTLPDISLREPVFNAKRFLDSIKIENDCLIFDKRIPPVCSYRESKWEDDYEVYASKEEKKYPITGGESIRIPEYMTSVCIEAGDKGFKLSRTVEFEKRIRPQCFSEISSDMGKSESDDNTAWQKLSEKFQSEDSSGIVRNYLEHIKHIAGIGSNNRVHFGFCMPNILARKELDKYGISYTEPPLHITDRDRLFTMLDLIEQRVDCADFEICGLFRYLRLHEDNVDIKLSERIKEVLLNFRYWMNMDGSDGMCFWSENHSLMFYYAAMEAGSRYPNEWFKLAQMRGKELYLFGKEHILEWIDDVEKFGFEEFQSAVYLCVTFAVMLNIIDFADEHLSKRMKKICDNMLIQLAIQTFDSVEISPMGRVYRNILYPFLQGTQSILELVIEDAPVSYGEGWIAFLHGSSYKMPSDMKKYANKPVDIVYSNGNALIYTKKTEDFCITSTASPRKDGAGRWENIRRSTDRMLSHSFTKSVNESFHGTSFFEPGTSGYQQHMWSAALSKEAVFFANHPGTTSEHSDMRPGYWFGNGVMPAVVQDNDRNILGAVYHIPEEHPVKFTHLYLPKSRFEKVIVEDKWIYLQAGKGLAAVWCSDSLVPYDDMIFGCELRAYSTDMAYLAVCASLAEFKSIYDFKKYLEIIHPEFEYSTNNGEYKAELKLQGEVFLKWEEGSDTTQFVN